MIIAALIVFATLLVAWLVAPAEPRRRPLPGLEDVAVTLAQEGLAEAA
jgi:hypothetical protein